MIFTMAVFIMLLLGSCATYERMEQIDHEHESPGSVFSQAGFPLVPSGYPTYYYDGTTWTHRALELIRSAQNYILIDTFLIGEFIQTERIIRELAAAHQRGVMVRILMDSASYFRSDRHTGNEVYVPVQEMKDMGIEVVEYNPIRAWRIYSHLFLLDRDHRKFWVIDGEQVVVGGMNIDPDSLADPTDRGSLDGMTEVYSPGAAEVLVETFVNTWNAFSLDLLSNMDFPPAVPDETKFETEVWVIDQNRKSGSTVTTMFDAFVTQAQQELWFMQGYMIITKPLLERIRYAADRGVDVHVILSDNHVGGRFVQATFYGILDLIEAGARVYVYNSPTGSLLHKKMILADNRLVSVGSANYNFRSQYLAREISLVFDDPVASERVMPFLKEVMEHSREIDIEEARSYRGLGYLLPFLMMQLGG